VLLAVSDEMYQRFFGYDASLEVGGVAINASGRTAAWEAMIADIRTPMQLWFGSGAGAGSTFVSLRFVNLPHPHNDYLRYLYDFGLFGLCWFLAFALAAVVMLWNRLRAARAADDRPAVGLPLGTLLALLGVLVSMLTDNSANYIYVMAPLAILLARRCAAGRPSAGAGAGLGVPRGGDAEAAPGTAPRAAQAREGPHHRSDGREVGEWWSGSSCGVGVGRR
jgi:O-antigen ligase